MAERKIVVPEGMLAAAWEAVAAKMRQYQDENRGDHIAELHVARISLEAALRWLSENPIVPSEGQERSLDFAWTESKRSLSSPYEKFAHSTAFGAVEWQRHMFLAPEPEVPEAIKDLLCGLEISADYIVSRKGFNTAILEAYRRGQKAGKQ